MEKCPGRFLYKQNVSVTPGAPSHTLEFLKKLQAGGRYPWPHEAMAALGRILTRAAEEYEEPPQSHQPGVSPDMLRLSCLPGFSNR